jgi:hypothetical protein
MNIDQIEAELKHMATKEALADLRADIHKDLGDFKTDIVKTLWLTQLSIAGVILVGIGLMQHFHVP